MYQYKPPVKPQLPFYAEIIYWGSFACAILCSSQNHPYLHAIFSCCPLFMITKIILNRLQRGELGSTVICLSILAESVAHLFHQLAHDERFKSLYFFEHLICAMFLAFGNTIYVFEHKLKKHSKKPSKSPKVSAYMTSFAFILSGFYLMLYESQKDDSNSFLYYMRIAYALPLTVQLIAAMYRWKKTSKKSFFFGFAAAVIYVCADLVQEHHFLSHRFLHRLSIYLQAKQALTHVQWFAKNRLKLM